MFQLDNFKDKILEEILYQSFYRKGKRVEEFNVIYLKLKALSWFSLVINEGQLHLRELFNRPKDCSIKDFNDDIQYPVFAIDINTISEKIDAIYLHQLIKDPKYITGLTFRFNYEKYLNISTSINYEGFETMILDLDYTIKVNADSFFRKVT